MPDYGLLGGIGEGLKSFTEAYQSSKQKLEQQKEKQRAADRLDRNDAFSQAIQLKAANLQRNPSGQIEDTPEGKLKSQLENKQVQSGLDSYDLTSDTTRSRQGFVKGLMGQAGVKGGFLDSVDQMSAHDIGENEKYLTPVISGEYGIKKERAGAGKSANKDMNGIRTLLESARGNPAAAQAERDLYAAQKFNTGMAAYPDPNNIPMAQVNLLSAEAGKIATGGVPGVYELDGITPRAVPQRLSVVASDLSNHPTPAKAGAYMTEMKKYIDGLSSDAQSVIEDKYGRVINSARSEIGDQNYNTLRTNYIDRFKNKATQQAPALDTRAAKIQELKRRGALK